MGRLAAAPLEMMTMYEKDFPTVTQHNFTNKPNEAGYYVCETCNHSVKIRRDGKCIGVPMWHKWDEIPDTMATKTTLSKEHGLRLTKGQRPVGAKVRYTHKGKRNGYYALYALNEATPKKQISPQQFDALEKARHMAEKLVVTCSNCGGQSTNRYDDYIKVTRKQWIEKDYDHYVCRACKDRTEAVVQSNLWLSNPHCVILDTETSGLHDAEIIEIAIIDNQGNTLLDTQIKPHHPERILEPSDGVCAYDIHGIHPDSLIGKPTLKDMYPKLKQLLTGKTILVYNEAFDIPLLQGLIESEGLEPIEFKSDCVMLWYAQFCGDWNDYWSNYKWQPLTGGDHSALGDCKATLNVIKEMAGCNDESC